MRPLTLLTQRAAQLFRNGNNNNHIKANSVTKKAMPVAGSSARHAPQLLEPLDNLSLVCASLRSLLSRSSGSDESNNNEATTINTRAALSTTATLLYSQLLVSTTELPAGVDLPFSIIERLMTIAADTDSLLLTEYVASGLLKQIDERVSPLSLTTLTPSQLLRLLHAFARQRASASSFDIIDDLVTHIHVHVRTYGAMDISRLLWCLAMLQLSHVSLWADTCRRCNLLLGKMNHVSRSTTMQAMLLVESCTSAAHQELMHTLLTTAEEASAEMHENTSNTDYDPASSNSQDKVRLRLLRNAHMMSSEVLLSVVGGLWPVPDSLARSAAIPEEVLYLLEQLSRRQLNGTDGVAIINLLVSRGRLHMKDTVDSLELLRTLATKAAGAIVNTAPQSMRDPQASLQALTLIYAATYHMTADDSSLHLSLDDSDAESLLQALVDVSEECVKRTVVGTFSQLPGSTYWAMLVATELVSLKSSISSRRHAAVDNRALETQRIARDCGRAWHSVSSTGSSSKKQQWEPSVFFVDAACQTDPVILNILCRNQESSLCNALDREVKALLAISDIPLPLVVRLIAGVEAASHSAIGPLLNSLSPHLLRILEMKETNAPTLLLELTNVLTGTRMSAGTQQRSVIEYIPDTLLDYYIRLLSKTSRPAQLLSDKQSSVLLHSFQHRTGDVERLERAFMMICTRRLGESKPFTETVTMSIPTIAQLTKMATILHDAHVNTSTTILSHLFGLLSRDGLRQCDTLEMLHEVASLLDCPVSVELGMKKTLAACVSQRAIEVMSQKACSGVNKAYLVAYLVRADVPVSDDLLEALRK